MATSNTVNGIGSGPEIVTLTDSNPFNSKAQKLPDPDQNKNVQFSIVETDPDPYVFGPSGSGSHNYGSDSGSFHHQANIVEKP
jgi:hypothetical protein